MTPALSCCSYTFVALSVMRQKLLIERELTISSDDDAATLVAARTSEEFCIVIQVHAR